MLIGALEDELLWPAPVPELELLPPLLQAARTPTESATALRVMTFLENQGRVVLTPGSSFLPQSSFFRVEPVGDIGVLTFEGYTGRFRLLRDERGEINVTVTSANRSLNEEL